MYLNFQTFKKHNLKPEDLFYLLAVKQIEKEQLETLPQDVIERFEALGILTIIKGAKSEAESLKIRLNDKGKKFLNSLFAENTWGEDEEIIFNWLADYYKKRGKEVGNPNRVKKLLKWFSEETGIYKNNLIKLFIDFLNDEYVEEESRVLEFTLFYPKKFTTDKGRTVAYEAKPDIFDSWIYKHFERNKERLIKTFEDYA
jgi:hypothetical protein